jgi:hypothetical protein
VVSKRTGNPRGRPRLPLAKAQNRFALAYLEHAILHGRALGIPQLRVIDTFVTAVLGEKVADAAQLEHLRRGRPGVWVYMPESRDLAALQIYNERPPAPWRYEHAFRPPIDDVRRELRRYREREQDARWLRGMVAVIELYLRGARIEDVRPLAESIGEGEFLAMLRWGASARI